MKSIQFSRHIIAICPLALPATVFAGELLIGVSDNLVNEIFGDAADASASHVVLPLASDPTFLRNGIDSASFDYVIRGQVSADDGLGGATDTANLSGNVRFNFNLPTALWTIRADATFRGAQDVDGTNATASAGSMSVSSSGSAFSLPDFSMSSGTLQFFNTSASRSLLNSTATGEGSVAVALNMSATSNDIFPSGGEAYAGIGSFSSLPVFTLDDTLNSLNPLSDDGAYITLTFTPSLALSGEVLNGDLALIAGEELSGSGRVQGDVSGVVGSTITAGTGGLILGDVSSPTGFDFSGTLNVGSNTVFLGDLDGATLRGSTVLDGGDLSASNRILLSSGASLTGSGTVSSLFTGAPGSSITATGDLSIGGNSPQGFDHSGTLDVGNNRVRLFDFDVADLGSSTTLAGGILESDNGVSIDGSDTISGYGVIIGGISGTNVPAGLLIAAPTGSVNLNQSLNLTGKTANIYSQLPAVLGGGIFLSNGTLIAANGIAFGPGALLLVGVGASVVDAATSVASGVTITVNSGVLEIGDAASTAGFVSEGELNVAGVVTLRDADQAQLGSSTVLSGGTLVAPNGIAIDGADTISGAGIIIGEITGTNAANGLVPTGSFVPGVLNVGTDTVTILTDAAVDLNSSPNLTGGTLRTTGSSIAIASNATLSGFGAVEGDFIGRAQSSIVASGGELALGDATSFNGFRTAGEIDTGADTVALNSATFATLGTVTTIGGGTLAAANGVFLSGGNVITGSGAIAGRLSAEAGALINATGDMVIGDSTAFDGFFSRGNLEINNHAVTLNDANAATLGSLTNIGSVTGPGTLHAANGLVLNGGNNIAGYGLVTADLVNQGSVIGQGPLPTDVLELSGTVSGIGDYQGNILFSGVFSPGNSPALVGFEDLILDGLLDIEIGGLNQGSEYDALIGTGQATLGGTLSLSLINGFTPVLGNSFDILAADTIVGEFDVLMPGLLSDGLKWDVSYILDDLGADYVRLSVSQVPVPAAVWLFISGFTGLFAVARRSKGSFKVTSC